MKNKKLIVIFELLLIICSILIFPVRSEAAGIWGNIIDGGQNFIDSGGEPEISETDLKTASASIYYVLLYIGIAVSVIIGAVLGIQFMLASAEDKAKVKEQLIPYLIGCFVVFGAFAIWKLIITILNNI